MVIEGSGAEQGSPLSSVVRALDVLTTVGEAGPQGLSLTDITGRLGLHKTTAHRSLAALASRGFVTRDEATRRYTLGAAALRLGISEPDGATLPSLAHEAMVALSAATGELVHLGVLRGADVIYVAKQEPDRAIRVWSEVGKSVPAATSALGRAILASRDLNEQGLATYVPAQHSTLTAAALAHVTAAARDRGFATEHEENEPGIACCAIALTTDVSARPEAALSVTAPADRLTPENVADIARLIRDVAGPRLPPPLALVTTR